MFTGLVAGLGEILQIEKKAQDGRLYIRPQFAFLQPVIGESVAINGVCLTVESIHDSMLKFYVSAETLACSTLSLLSNKECVNMERALALGDRLGGHMVSGHVDAMATVLSIKNVGDSNIIRIGFDPFLAPQIIPKGSVALDGISLTVNSCERDFLEVNVIPETQKITNMITWHKGKKVNLETDMIGKYILRSKQLSEQNPKSGIDENFLLENGFYR